MKQTVGQLIALLAAHPLSMEVVLNIEAQDPDRGFVNGTDITTTPYTDEGKNILYVCGKETAYDGTGV